MLYAYWTDDSYYEANPPWGRITSGYHNSENLIGDLWWEDDGFGGAFECDRREFHDEAIKLIGGPRNGVIVE